MSHYTPPDPAVKTIQHTSKLESDVFVPLLQSLAIAIVGTLAAFGFALLCSAPLRLAARIAAGTGLTALSLSTVLFILQHRAQVVKPLQLIRAQIDIIRDSVYVPDDPDDLVNHSPLFLRPRRTPQRLQAHNLELNSIEPTTSREILQLYQFITTVWPTGTISRDHCTSLPGITRAAWHKYVGGRRKPRGVESDRGILDRANLVYKDHQGWHIGATLHEALSINDELFAYAQAHATLVRPSRPGPTITPAPGPAGALGVGEHGDHRHARAAEHSHHTERR